MYDIFLMTRGLICNYLTVKKIDENERFGKKSLDYNLSVKKLKIKQRKKGDVGIIFEKY